LEQYTYSSAPNTGETLVLDCSNAWKTQEAENKWKVIGDGKGPEVAWHTMDSLGDEVLLFGGDGGIDLPIQTRNDSTWFINLNNNSKSPSSSNSVVPNVSYEQQTTTSQPIRKIYSASSASSDHQTVFLTGGEKADGSRLGYNEAWSITSTMSSQRSVTYTPLSPLPSDLVHHQSILLANGTLILLGGYIPSASSFLPLNTMYVLDTRNAATASWRTVVLPSSSSTPKSRRGHTASVITAKDGTERFLLIGGMTSADVLDDIWLLDPSKGEWKRVDGGLDEVDASERRRAERKGGRKRDSQGALGKRDEMGGPGGRYDHIAQVIDGQVVIFGGKYSFLLRFRCSSLFYFISQASLM